MPYKHPNSNVHIADPTTEQARQWPALIGMEVFPLDSDEGRKLIPDFGEHLRVDPDSAGFDCRLHDACIVLVPEVSFLDHDEGLPGTGGRPAVIVDCPICNGRGRRPDATTQSERERQDALMMGESNECSKCGRSGRRLVVVAVYAAGWRSANCGEVMVVRGTPRQLRSVLQHAGYAAPLFFGREARKERDAASLLSVGRGIAVQAGRMDEIEGVVREARRRLDANAARPPDAARPARVRRPDRI